MLKRIAYSLYRFSNSKDLNHRVTVAVMVIYFILYVNTLMIWKITCVFLGIDFIKVFMKYNLTALITSILGFLLIRYLVIKGIKQVRYKTNPPKLIRVGYVFLYAILSFITYVILMNA
jgi:hypothetical protein